MSALTLSHSFVAERNSSQMIMDYMSSTRTNGGGKTFSVIRILLPLLGKKKIITNVKSFYNNYKDKVIFEDNFENLMKYLLNQDDLSDTVVFYDEIFSYFDDVGLPDDASDVFTQLRKRHLHFFTTSQLWTELPKKFRKLCRYEVSVRILTYSFLPFSILVNEFNDGYKVTWDNDSQQYICPRLWTTYSKCNLIVCNSYDTYEVIHHKSCSSSLSSSASLNTRRRRR